MNMLSIITKHTYQLTLLDYVGTLDMGETDYVETSNINLCAPDFGPNTQYSKSQRPSLSGTTIAVTGAGVKFDRLIKDAPSKELTRNRLH